MSPTDTELTRARIIETQAHAISTLATIPVYRDDEGTTLSKIIEAVALGDLTLLMREEPGNNTEPGAPGDVLIP